MREPVALYVDPRGPYPKLVSQWFDESRDARLYVGPAPVVAHPPCSRWCRLAGLVQARWGHKIGDDGGCFASALATLRRVGGVLEHPAYSKAWPAFGLPKPPTGGGWVPGALPGEWTCYVEQCRYGHMAKKATWLYYVGAEAPPELLWGVTPDRECKALVSWCGNHLRGRANDRPRLTHKQAIHSPPLFAEMLIGLARQAEVRK